MRRGGNGDDRGTSVHERRSVTGRGADLLVEALVRTGVGQLFGVPGDTGVAFYDALFSRTDDIRHVLARDERHAAAMADAYARATNRAGVVEVSSGGGATYVIGGLGEAFASGVPVLVVVSDIRRASRGTGALTEIDQQLLFAAVTKKAVTVTRAADLPGCVVDALHVATSRRPGPVVLIVPEDVLDEKATGEFAPCGDLVASPAARPGAPQAAVTGAARALASATRPAILVGGGIHASGAYQSLTQVAERIGAGVATTIHGKGAITDANPWALGVAGNNGGSTVANGYLADADTVLIVGSRANATDTDSYTAPSRSATVVGVDTEPSRIQRNYPEATILTGDATTVLDQLIAELPELDTSAIQARRDDIAAHRARGIRRRSSDRPRGTLPVDEVVDALVDALSRTDATVVADPGAPTPAVADRWPVSKPGRSIICPRGHGPMGYAIPAAVGVAFARPGRPVLALTADGSFAMSCGELETIARFNLPIIAVQLTNHSLGWIKMLQHLYQGGRYFSVDPGPIDAVAVAQACGMNAARPTTVDSLHEHVQAALRDRAPVYLDVEVLHMIDDVPQVPAWHRALAGDPTRPAY